MQKFLNLTLPLKQDKASLDGLKKLLEGFDTQSFTANVEKALTGAETVHFARFMLIDDKYIQIITTFDGDELEYAEFFWKKLNPVFKAAYEFIEGAPTGDDWTLDNFHAFNDLHQLRPFFRFSAYPDKTVRDINNLNSPGLEPAHQSLSSNGPVEATMTAQRPESSTARPVPSSVKTVAMTRESPSSEKNAAPTAMYPNLGNVQGLIVRAYTHTYSRHLLLNIKDAAAGRRLLSKLSPMMTSAKDWPEDQPRPNRLLNLGITYNGLKALRVKKKIVDGMTNNINGFPLEFRKSGEANPDFSNSAGFIGDSAPSGWWANAQRPFTSADIHLILHLYNRDADDLKKFTDEIRALLSKQVEELRPMAGGGTIDGNRISEKRDHFGYRDGISQPKINWPGMNADSSDADFRDFLLGYANDDHQSAPTGDFARDGSYLVFQLIYQDVAYFNQFLKTEAGKLPAHPGISDMQEWLAAKLVGRWRSGSPIVTSPFEAGNNPTENDFRYSGDPQGHGCPFSAHIRIGNPRDQMINPTATPAPRLIRRGIPYGTPLEGNVDDGADRGLIGIFICASIARQYLRISRWINRNDFSPVISDKTAQDPIQGNREFTNASKNFRIPLPDQDLVLQGLRSFVRTTGAVYCFLPSLQTIKDLGEGKYRKP